jgi:hypothetical protein
MDLYQVFRCSEDFFVTPYPPGFKESIDDRGLVYTPAEVIQAYNEAHAYDEAQALEVASAS